LRLSFFCSTFAHASRTMLFFVLLGSHWLLIASDSSTPYVQKKWRSKKKITIYLRKSNICCNFAASFQRKRRHSPSVVRRLRIFKLIIPIGFTEISQIFRNHKHWHLLVHISCTTFVVFVIRAMREPL